jgi:hypothetical protein
MSGGVGGAQPQGCPLSRLGQAGKLPASAIADGSEERCTVNVSDFRDREVIGIRFR